MPRKPGWKRTPEERERERRNKWVQRQRKKGRVNVTAADAPQRASSGDRHAKPYSGEISDPLADWQIAFEEAMGDK